jgi:hypothetical protein
MADDRDSRRDLRSVSVSWVVPLAVVAFGFGTSWSATPAAEPSNIARAKRFRELLAKKDYDAARAMMANDARRWWDAREGEGRPWKIGPDAGGPWAAWDKYFHSQHEVLEWREEPHSATALVQETNDYYRLLERGAMRNELVYYFDDDGKIDGLVIRGAGERPMGLTDEFIAWAKKNDPEEIAALMPGGEIDPAGDHPERFRRLLDRWRRATGRQPIE